ncbi:MAG: citrulline utilization hydrolase CtlX [Steroidobacteraceae bacterium]
MSIESLGGAQARSPKTAPQQCAGAVLMIRPAAFDYNPETALTNKMQQPSQAGTSGQMQALQEFEQFAQALRSEAIAVCAVDDTPTPAKPDAIFPNNWVSFHEDGTVVLYPMQAESRRRERRQQIIETLVEQLGLRVSRVLDLTKNEAAGRFLEGTGSLVLDRCNRVAYACISPRTDPALVEEWARELGYEAVLFEAFDRGGVPFYHTNVMMCIGARMAVLGTCAMSADDRARVIEKLEITGRDVIEIQYDEIEQFAGNMLELASWDEALGDYRLLVMSESARRSLRPEIYTRLSASTDYMLAVPIPTIERLGGGSVRCMLAEVFLPLKASCT